MNKVRRLIFRCAKTRRRNWRVYIGLDVFFCLFFLCFTIFLRVFQLFLNAIATNNLEVEKLSISQIDRSFQLFLTVLAVGLFVLLLGIFLFSCSHFSTSIKQFFVFFQEKLKTKVLLGISPSVIACEFLVEILLFSPVQLIFMQLLGNFMSVKIIESITEMLPVEQYFVKNGVFDDWGVQSVIYLMLFFIFGLRYFWVRRKVKEIE